MFEETRSLTYRQSPKNLLAVFIAAMAGTAVFFAASAGGNMWMAATSLGLMALFSFLVITRNYRLFLVMCAVFVLPIRLDFHLIFKETSYAQLKGLPITLFDLIFAVLFLAWIVQLMLGQQKLRWFPRISVPALTYILLAGVSAFLSQDKTLAFSMLFLIIKGYLIFLYFSNNVESKEQFITIVIILSLGVLVQSFFGVLQFVTGQGIGLGLFGAGERATLRSAFVGYVTVSRVAGTIGDPNSLAMYLNFFLPAFLCFLFIDAPLRDRILIAISILLAGLTELLTLSRGGWVALTFGGLISMYGIFKDKLRSRAKSLVCVSLCVLFVAISTLGLFQSVRDRLFKEDYGAAYSRFPMMKVAFNIIEDNPLRGVGLNNYATRMNRYDHTPENISYRFPFPVHNAFLIIAGESGLLALASFLMILLGAFSIALRFFRGGDPVLAYLGIGFFCGILTWMIHAQFKMDFAGTNIVLWFSLGIVAALHRAISVEERRAQLKTKE